MNFTLCETRLGLLNSTTRLPFRYGRACLTRCPQVLLEVTIDAGGQRQRGYAADCLPPSWFDKSPDKTYRQQIDDMLSSIARGQRLFAEAAARPVDFFTAWRRTIESAQAEARRDGADNPLLVGFGVSLVERAVMDALARRAGMSLAAAVRTNLYRIRPGEIHPSLAQLQPADWLPAEPVRSIAVRHTVGLGDPLTVAEIPAEERLDDGFPQALEEYIVQSGVRYFKVKITYDVEQTFHRLCDIAAVCERHLGANYHVTLDGNEQFHDAEPLEELIHSLRGTPRLRTFLGNVLVIEQPLARHLALDPHHAAGIRDLCHWRPVIIDESDGSLDAYAKALALGYRGTSSKNCKGPIKSLLNAGLTWLANDRGRNHQYVMTGEDLCSVGVVAMQADLALVATLGLSHIERNGHHYHPGLSYLPPDEQQATLAAHADLYERKQDRIAPRVTGGRFAIDSLHAPGFGFSALPDMNLRQPAETWDFNSLGLEE